MVLGFFVVWRDAMDNTAILVDGGFYRKRLEMEWKSCSPEKSAEVLLDYCKRHLVENGEIRSLYRIFYYDCPPVSKNVFDPLSNKTVNFGKSDGFVRMSGFLNALKEKRKVALRLGSLDDGNIVYTFTYDTVKRICDGSLKRQGLDRSCLQLSLKQKGVDMKIGLDIASLAYKRQVGQIVLIAGDSDFVPAAKLARKEGIDFILDPLGMNLSHDNGLFEHVDGIRTLGDPYKLYGPMTDESL